MIGHLEPGPQHRRHQPDLVDIFGDVASEAGDIGGALGIAAVAREQVAVILDHGAAARGGDQDGVEQTLAHRCGPGVDIAAGGVARGLVAAKRMNQRTAAGLVLDDDDVDAVAPEQPDGRRRDRGREHLLDAAEHQCDALSLGHVAERRFRLAQLSAQPLGRHEIEGCGDMRMADARDQRAERTHHPAEHESEPEGVRVRHQLAEHEAQGALRRAAMRFHLDAGARELDEMHVVHPTRAGGHAGEAGEAAVDMVHRRRRHLAALEHLLHQIDAAARAVALVAGQHIGRARGGAQPAMHAALEDGVGARDGRVGELERVEARLHGSAQIPEYMRPGLRMPAGSNACLTRAESAASGPSSGWNTSITDRASSLARIRVPCPPNSARVRRISTAPASVRAGVSSQISPPDQS